MRKKHPFTILGILLSFGVFAQATLDVDGHAFFGDALGIGISPTSTLHVTDIGGDNDAVIEFNASGVSFVSGFNVSSGFLNGTVTSDRYSFITSNVVRMILSTTGQLGIGTPGPTEKLHVREDGLNGQEQTVMVVESNISKIPQIKFDEGSNHGMSIQYDGSGSGSNNKINILDTTGDKIATFTNGGLLGINESSPTEMLDVNGTVIIDGSGSDNELIFREGTTEAAKLRYDGTHLRMDNNDLVGSIILTGDSDCELEGFGDILLDTSDDILFRTNGTTKGFLSHLGKFGINQINPEGMFHVRAFENNVPALRMENDQNSNHWSMQAKSDNLDFQYNGVVVGRYNGLNGAYSIVSDRRFKENIAPIEDGVLDKINQLEASSYYYISDEQKEMKSLGFIAQDVLEIFPDVVYTPESEDSFYGIQYATMAVFVIKAIQEQQIEIEWLQSEIDKKKHMKEKIEANRELANRLQAEIYSIKTSELKE